MQKKQDKKSLALSKEIVRTLGARELAVAGVAGGVFTQLDQSCALGCPGSGRVNCMV